MSDGNSLQKASVGLVCSVLFGMVSLSGFTLFLLYTLLLKDKDSYVNTLGIVSFYFPQLLENTWCTILWLFKKILL